MNRFLPALLLAVVLPVAATEMYSWTDANGVKHFSDSPPPSSGMKAQKLKVKGGVTSGEAVDPAAPKEDASNTGPALAAAAGYSPEDIKRNCDVAKTNLSSLQGREVAKDADGYPVDLVEAKRRQEQMDKANQQIKLFCSKQ